MSASLDFLAGTAVSLDGALRTSGSSSSDATGLALGALALGAGASSSSSTASTLGAALACVGLPGMSIGAALGLTPSACATVMMTARLASSLSACRVTMSYSASSNQRTGVKNSLGLSALVSNFMRVTICSGLTGGVCAARNRAYACSGRLSPSSLPKIDVAGSVSCSTSPSGLLASTTARRCWKRQARLLPLPDPASFWGQPMQVLFCGSLIEASGFSPSLLQQSGPAILSGSYAPA